MESSTQNFIDPVQAIKPPMNMQTWNTSEAYRDLLGFILTVGESIKGIKSSDECHVSEPIEKLVTMLNTFEGWIDEIPPIDQPQRFGNKAFRTWSRKLFDDSDDLIITLLSEECKEAVIELKVYLHDSFGNATRIDYGTGHEISFVYFLLCLYKLKLMITLLLSKYFKSILHCYESFKLLIVWSQLVVKEFGDWTIFSSSPTYGEVLNCKIKVISYQMKSL